MTSTKGNVFSMKSPDEVPDFRRFIVHRKIDSTGTSGTGVVATGVCFPSGQCVIEWTSIVKSISVFHSIADVEKIHGHGGNADLLFIDEDRIDPNTIRKAIDES